MSVFIDSSIWFAAIVAKDANNQRAKRLLAQARSPVTTDHVVVETWLLLNARHSRAAAEAFWERAGSDAVRVEYVTAIDMESAWRAGGIFPDQDFSIVDLTSFAVMERLGILKVASFDHHFAIYRFGRNRDKAFEVLR